MNEQQIAAMRQALKRAFQLGQNYWSWADSEYSSHWKKADAAKAEFDKLVEDTLRTAIEEAEKQEPVAWVCTHYEAGMKNDVDYWQDEIDALPVGTPLYTTPPAA